MLLCDERKMESLEMMKKAEFMLVEGFRIIGDLGEFMTPRGGVRGGFLRS